HDEVGELARAFNSMSEELAEVDRMRRELVANASHELRTPLGALQATLENMVDGVEPADPETLQAALGQVERLGALIAQLLDLSQLESGAVGLDRERVPVRALLEEVVAEHRLDIDVRDLRVAVVVNPESLELDADRGRMQQVVRNLVANAIRHSPDGGRLVVRAAAVARAGGLGGVAAGPGVRP